MAFERRSLISQAFEYSIKSLGYTAVRALIEDLKRSGIDMNNLTLEQLATGLREVLGGEATDIIVEDVIIKLDELYSTLSESA